jgi:ATPase subunit of ABC transporter with duplicated ATPase domains
MAILEVKDLNYSIKNRLLYKDVAFNLYKGDKMGVVGQNGAGKSTLINILVGKVEHDQGSIT